MKFKIGMYIKHMYEFHKNEYEIFQIINLDKLAKTSTVKMLYDSIDPNKGGCTYVLVNYPEWEKLKSISCYRFPHIYCI